MYLGDLKASATIDFTFTTVNTSGAPTTLAGTPAISVYRGNSTAQTTAGVTLTVDLDGVTGLNHVRLVLGDGFYTTGNDYHVVITTGTVGGTSVVGYVVAEFSIENRGARLDLTQVNTTETAKTTVGGQLRRVHALAGGNGTNQDFAVANAPIVHRNEADSADLITMTQTNPTDTKTVHTPS